MNYSTQLYVANNLDEVSDSHYDNFFWNKKKRGKKRPKKTAEQRATGKQKRKAFWGGLGNGVRDSGGVGGILESAHNLFGFFRGNEGTDTPSDYEVGMGASEEPNNKNEKGLPVGLLVAGGIGALVVVGYFYNQNQKNQAALLAATK